MSQFSGKQARALQALAEGATNRAAAEVAGISERQLCRWLTDQAFRGALQEAQRQAIDATSRRLAGMAGGALDVLEDLMGGAVGAHDNVRRLAAVAVLDNFYRFVAVAQLEERVAALEAKGK